MVSAQLERAIREKKDIIQRRVVRYSRGGSRRRFPWREPGRTPYEVLIAEVTLKRTTATAAKRAYPGLLERFPSLETLRGAPLEEIAEAFSPIGLHWQRARSLKELAGYLANNEDGKVPEHLEALLRVPGIGQYTARAVLSFAYDVPVAIVDSNVKRVFGRVFKESLPSRPGRRLYQELADRLLPRDHHAAFNWGILDMGALVCRPTDPLHDQCPIAETCDWAASDDGLEQDVCTVGAGLPARLRGVRHKRGLSLVELASRSGLSKKTIVNAEKGRSTPRRETIEKLAAALGVEPGDLVRR